MPPTRPFSSLDFRPLPGTCCTVTRLNREKLVMSAISGRLVAMVRGLSGHTRTLHSSPAVLASSELVELVVAAHERRLQHLDAKGEAGFARERLDAALAALSVARSSSFASSSDGISAARADVTAAAYELARVGPDLSALPVRRLHDVTAYAHLGNGPLSGFSAAELLNGVLAIDLSDEKVPELLTAISKEATGRVDEFPVHALGALADALAAGGAECKAFLRAATESAAKRAHLAKLSDSFRLILRASNAGVGCQELSAEAGTMLAASHESAIGGSVMTRSQLTDRTVLVLSTAGPEFSKLFAAWAARLVQSEAASFVHAADVERLTTALERAGGSIDRATQQAVRRAAAARARREEAAALRGFRPEDYGVAGSLSRQ